MPARSGSSSRESSPSVSVRIRRTPGEGEFFSTDTVTAVVSDGTLTLKVAASVSR